MSMRMTDVNEEHDKALMARVAWLYYNHGLTQQAIGDKIGLSRNKVLRLLARAREEGIVQIRVDHPSIRFMELEERLVETFDCREAIVVPAGDVPEQTLEAIGQFGAIYLERTVEPGDAIGTAWGVTLREVARHLRPRGLTDVTVVQLMGGLHAGGLINPLDVARVVAEKFDGRLQTLYTPAIVDTPEIRDALLSDNTIAQTLSAGAAVQKALVGIGDVSETSSLVRWQALTADEMAELRRLGAVGDILGRHFDAWGRPVETPLSGRTIGISLDTLRSIPHVIAVAGGPHKTEAIAGALRGGYVDTLITDDKTATAVLEAGNTPS